MTEPLVWYQIRWPREVTESQITTAFRLLVTVAGAPVIIEAIGKAGVVTHRIAIPRGRCSAVVQQLRVVIPGMALDTLEHRPEPEVNRAIDIRLSTRQRALRIDDIANVSRAMLTALAHVGRAETLSIQWVLGKRVAPMVVPNSLDKNMQQSWAQALLTAPFGSSSQADAEQRHALRSKQNESGWRAVGRLGVSAASKARQRQLIRQVLGAISSVESPGVSFWVHGIRPDCLIHATVPWRFPLQLNASEMATVSTWPIGQTNDLPIHKLGSRLMPPSRAIRRSGRVIGQATFPGKERPLALTPTDSLRHLHVLGPSGSGKSTLLLNLIIQDINAGRSVTVIEPKSDLINDILKHIPPERIDDVVLISPTDTHPVGINPLALAGRSAELASDQLLAVFHSMFESWGPRVSEILGAAILTMAQTPDATLASLILLLTDAGYRRKIVGKLNDPIVLQPFWAQYEAMSENERAMAIAPVMRRLRPLLLRTDVRGMIGQAKPRFDLRHTFREKKILLVDLSKGILGSETASLLGSLVVSMLWDATLGRAAVPQDRRGVSLIVLDEFQNYLKLQTDLAEALAESRGLGVSWTLAHQYLDQLDPSMKNAVLSNVQSRAAFRLPHKDAVAIATGSTLAPDDFVNLNAYECYVQLVAEGSVQPWASAKTQLPPEPISDPDVVKAASRKNYGIDRNEVEAELRNLINQQSETANDDDFGPRRRSRGDK